MAKRVFVFMRKPVSSLNLLESDEVASLVTKQAEFYASQVARINSP
jgi:hypothetical protein